MNETRHTPMIPLRNLKHSGMQRVKVVAMEAQPSYVWVELPEFGFACIGEENLTLPEPAGGIWLADNDTIWQRSVPWQEGEPEGAHWFADGYANRAMSWHDVCVSSHVEQWAELVRADGKAIV